MRPPSKFECLDCATVDGCDMHRVFKCESCERPTHWRDGGDDERPNDCSDCWLAYFAPRRDIAVALASYLEAI